MTWYSTPLRLARTLTPAGVLALNACDIPTDLPRVETRFVVPGEATVVRVDELLPDGVTVSEGNFELSMGARAFPSMSIGEMCGTFCAPLHGMLVPKPAFTGEIPITLDLTDQVASATLVSGNIFVTVIQNFGFDPLQPSGRTTDGRIEIDVLGDDGVLGTGTLTGPFPSGTGRSLSIALTPGVVTGELEVRLRIVSPAGGLAPQHWVVVDTSASMYGSAAPNQVLVSEATVNVETREVTADGASIDLTDISLDERVTRGGIVLTTRNPFAVTGTMHLVLTGEDATVQKDVQVSPGESVQRLDFTGPEIQSLLGSIVTLSVEGDIVGVAPITIRPDQVIEFENLLDLVFELGPGD